MPGGAAVPRTMPAAVTELRNAKPQPGQEPPERPAPPVGRSLGCGRSREASPALWPEAGTESHTPRATSGVFGFGPAAFPCAGSRPPRRVSRHLARQPFGTLRAARCPSLQTRQGTLPVPHDTSRHDLVPATPGSLPGRRGVPPAMTPGTGSRCGSTPAGRWAALAASLLPPRPAAGAGRTRGLRPG